MKFPIMLRSTHYKALKDMKHSAFAAAWEQVLKVTVSVCKESEHRRVHVFILQRALARKNRRIKKLQEQKT